MTDEEDAAAAGVAGAQHTSAEETAVGGQGADDAGASRAVPAEVALGVLFDDGIAVLAKRNCDGALQVADKRMPALNSTVEDADPNVRARRAAPRPLAVHPLRPVGRQRDALDRFGGQAPGGELLVRFHERH